MCWRQTKGGPPRYRDERRCQSIEFIFPEFLEFENWSTVLSTSDSAEEAGSFHVGAKHSADSLFDICLRRPRVSGMLDHSARIVTTNIPARLDRMPWTAVRLLSSRWVYVDSGGLEVTLCRFAGRRAFRDSPTLRFSAADVGVAGSAYLAGPCLLRFFWLADGSLGSQEAVLHHALGLSRRDGGDGVFLESLDFALCRFFTGAGIGGEYTAINSTIQELVPARVRGHTDLIINGSFWIGAAAGAAGSIVLLDPALFAPDIGWRVAFFSGAVLGLIVFSCGCGFPKARAGLMTHGYPEKAEAIVAEIERSAGRRKLGQVDLAKPQRLRSRSHTPLQEVFDALFRQHRRRTMIGLALMASQAFFTMPSSLPMH